LTSGGVLTVGTGAITSSKILDGTIAAADLSSADYSSKITSGTYSINITGSAGSIANGVYTNAANTITPPVNTVPLSLIPVTASTAHVLDIYNNAVSPAITSYFDLAGVFHGSGANITSIPNSGLTNSSVTVTAGTGLSGGGSVALGSSVTINNAGVTSLAKTGGTARTGALSLTEGSGATITDNGDGTFTIAATGTGGTVTSVASGSGLTGGPITVSGTLSVDSSTVPFLANDQSFTGKNTFSRNGASTGDYTVGITGTPVADGTSSLVRIGNAIQGGNAAASGGTYLGINLPSSGAGSAADFLNFQNNNTVEFKVTSAGVATINGGLTVSAGGATITGTLQSLVTS